MLKSMYSGVSGMRGFQTKLDVIGNNIANVNTTGFKKSRVMFQDLLSQNMGDGGVNTKQVGLGVTNSAIDTMHTAGSLMTTGVKTDLSIEGEGYFQVQREEANGGTTDLLTSSGNFYINSDKELVTSQGYNVLNDAGQPITNLPSDFAINRQGQIIETDQNGNPNVIATIGVATVNNPAGLTKDGGSAYLVTDKSGPPLDGLPDGSRVVSGQLEMSNVDLTEEFTEMIVAQRGFQANSRVITTSDEILQEIVNLKR